MVYFASAKFWRELKHSSSPAGLILEGLTTVNPFWDGGNLHIEA